jgi:hypothetical protein
MSNNLVEKISDDLNISKFAKESDAQFGNRLMYSALVAWARVQVLGKSYSDFEKEHDYHNVDILYAQSRVAKVAYGMLNAIQYEAKWLKDSESEDLEMYSNKLTSFIIEKMIFCYELSKINGRRLTISPIRTTHFNKNRLLLGGTKWSEDESFTVGMGRWVGKCSDLVDYKSIFNIPEYSITDYYKILSDDALWVENDLNGRYKIFLIGKEGWYLKSWIDFKSNRIPEGISLIRSMETGGGYFLINKKTNDNILSARLDKWYRDENEIYRIMYALNVFNKTPAIFEAEDNNDHVILHCNSKLPNAEMRIIMLASWPRLTFDDIFYRIIPKFLWKDIESLLNELGIIVQFKNY